MKVLHFWNWNNFSERTIEVYFWEKKLNMEVDHVSADISTVNSSDQRESMDLEMIE